MFFWKTMNAWLSSRHVLPSSTFFSRCASGTPLAKAAGSTFQSPTTYFPSPYRAVALGIGYAQWPQSGSERLTGGTPRYQIYRTRDGRHIAAAPLEQRF